MKVGRAVGVGGVCVGVAVSVFDAVTVGNSVWVRVGTLVMVAVAVGQRVSVG